MKTKHADSGEAAVIISFSLAALFTVIAIVELLTGCGGEPFTSVQLDTAVNDATMNEAATTSSNAEAKDAEVKDVAASDDRGDWGETEAGLVDVLFDSPHNDSSSYADASAPDACISVPSQQVNAPPECAPAGGFTVPDHYALVQNSAGGNSCSWQTTPSKCACAFDCECLLAGRTDAESCSCRIVDQVLPVVTCL